MCSRTEVMVGCESPTRSRQQLCDHPVVVELDHAAMIEYQDTTIHQAGRYPDHARAEELRLVRCRMIDGGSESNEASQYLPSEARFMFWRWPREIIEIEQFARPRFRPGDPVPVDLAKPRAGPEHRLPIVGDADAVRKHQNSSGSSCDARLRIVAEQTAHYRGPQTHRAPNR